MLSSDNRAMGSFSDVVWCNLNGARHRGWGTPKLKPHGGKAKKVANPAILRKRNPSIRSMQAPVILNIVL